MRVAGFSGSVKDFKLYLLARRTWLELEIDENSVAAEQSS